MHQEDGGEGGGAAAGALAASHLWAVETYEFGLAL
jgi:hypothetical protein